jgi:hypothetical protein
VLAKVLLRRGGWSHGRVIYSKGVLGAARMSVNYSKDDIKARKRLRCYLIELLSQMPIPDSDCLGDSLRFSRRDAGLESLEMTSFSLVIQTSYGGLTGTQTRLGALA